MMCWLLTSPSLSHSFSILSLVPLGRPSVCCDCVLGVQTACQDLNIYLPAGQQASILHTTLHMSSTQRLNGSLLDALLARWRDPEEEGDLWPPGPSASASQFLTHKHTSHIPHSPHELTSHTTECGDPGYDVLNIHLLIWNIYAMNFSSLFYVL